MIASSVQAMVDLHKLSDNAPGPLLRAVALGGSGGAFVPAIRAEITSSPLTSPDCTCAAPLRSMRASRMDMSTFPDRNNFPLLEDHCRLMECVAHEGLRVVAHDFQPDGSWQRPLAQSLPR